MEANPDEKKLAEPITKPDEKKVESPKIRPDGGTNDEGIQRTLDERLQKILRNPFYSEE